MDCLIGESFPHSSFSLRKSVFFSPTLALYCYENSRMRVRENSFYIDLVTQLESESDPTYIHADLERERERESKSH